MLTYRYLVLRSISCVKIPKRIPLPHTLPMPIDVIVCFHEIKSGFLYIIITKIVCTLQVGEFNCCHILRKISWLMITYLCLTGLGEGGGRRGRQRHPNLPPPMPCIRGLCHFFPLVFSLLHKVFFVAKIWSKILLVLYQRTNVPRTALL